jgi:hypothetical protein
MTTLLIIPPAAFINANDRLHHHKRAVLTRVWRETAASLVLTHRPRLVPMQRAHITVGIRFANNVRRDIGNWYPTAKACVDGIVGDAGLLPGDDDEHLIGPDMRRIRPNGTPLVVITITEV